MIVIDASVALKWVMPEPDGDLAHALLSEKLGAPALWLIEAGNALWRHAVAKKITTDDARQSFAKLQAAPVEILPIESELNEALSLSMRLNHPIYDCIYLAAAMDRNTWVVTADKRFIDAVSRDVNLKQYVKRLGT